MNACYVWDCECSCYSHIVGFLLTHVRNQQFLFIILWQRRILNYTKYEMLSKALDAFDDLVDDEELGPADWPTVKRYITSLNDVDGERIHPHSSSANDDNPDHMNLKDIRVRFLNGKLFMTLYP